MYVVQNHIKCMRKKCNSKSHKTYVKTSLHTAKNNFKFESNIKNTFSSFVTAFVVQCNSKSCKMHAEKSLHTAKRISSLI